MDRDDEDEAITEQIKICQQETNQTYVYRRVKIWLQRKGLQINHKTVLRIMNKYDLSSEIRWPKKYKICSQQIHKYDNILNKNFIANNCNNKWVTDISYIHTKQGNLYLSVIKDLYAGFIVAYKTGANQTVNLVADTIRSAIQKEKVVDGLVFHSDQGFQYTSKEYYSLTTAYGITLRCQDVETA